MWLRAVGAASPSRGRRRGVGADDGVVERQSKSIIRYNKHNTNMKETLKPLADWLWSYSQPIASVPWVVKISIIIPGVFVFVDIFSDVFASGAAELFLLIVYLVALTVLILGFLVRPLADVEDGTNDLPGTDERRAN